MKTVAVMQPNFFPYPGYYRLFEVADIFVVYDCVQFVRRGWIHRNRMTHLNATKWLSLPLKKQCRDIKIKDCEFSGSASEIWPIRVNQFEVVQRIKEHDKVLYQLLINLEGDVIDYLIATMKLMLERLNLDCQLIRSSELELGETKASGRVIKICEALQATRYVNASGGHDLYEPQCFADKGIELKFLKPFSGSHLSILNFISGGYDNLSKLIKSETRVEAHKSCLI